MRNAARNATIKRLREEGNTYAAIGSWVNLSVSRVGKVLFKIAPELCGRVRKTVISGAYIMVYDPHHHKSNSIGYVREHVIVAETKLGRPIDTGEIVHHIDLDTFNNAPVNLWVYATAGEHRRAHWGMNNLIKGLMDREIVVFKDGQYILAE